VTTSLAVCSSGLQEEKETIRISRNELRNDTKTAAKLCHGNVDRPNGSKRGDIMDVTDIAFGGRNNCCTVDLIAGRSRSALYSKKWSRVEDRRAADTRTRLMEMPQEKASLPK
jgi:hypothetical protein